VIWLPLLAAGAANFGSNVHLPPTDTLDLEVDLGGKWIRIDFNWDIAQPAQGTFNWQPFDTVIDAAVARGLRVYATMGYTPAWASTGDRMGDGASNDVPDPAAYRAFVEAAVTRYKDRVGIFGTWNEPNLGQFFEGTRDEWIANVYRPAVLGIRAACPTCIVAGPEVATIGTAYADYIQAALAAEVPTVLSGHIYADFPEDNPQAGLTKDSYYNKLDAHRVIGPFQGPLSIRESAIAAGHSELPVWITETGRAAAVGNATDLEGQRKFMQHMLDAMDTRPWWAGTIIYELSEEHPGGAFPDDHFGIVLRTADPDATPLDNFQHKPAYDYRKARLAAAPPPMDDAGVGDAGVSNPDALDPANPDAGGNGEQPGGGPAGCGCATSGPSSGELLLGLGAIAILGRRRRR
jgi:MYXO-CTERM domain-containing protein